jgi:hypothetical protein
LSIGIEHVDDIIADLDCALQAAADGLEAAALLSSAEAVQ